MRSLVLMLALVSTAWSCATVRPAVIVQRDSTARLAGAESLVRAGCLDCLLAAYREYEALRAEPSAAPSALPALIRTSALIGLRERELGMIDRGYFERAEDLAASSEVLRQSFAPLLEIASTIPARFAGAGQITDEIQFANYTRARKNRDAWSDLLRERAEESELTAYLWLGFNCAYGNTFPRTADGLLDAIPRWGSTPLLRFRAATCGSPEPDALRALLDQDPRFLEIHYQLGLNAVGRRDPDEADVQFRQAYDWAPRWPSLTGSMANVAMTAEDFDRALRLYEETLTLAPWQPDSMLGKVRALTYLGRYEDALIAVDDLLSLERWHVGEARYWRALNGAQLSRLDEAWTDIELAAKLLVNAEVPKLAGLIAFRRQQLDTARQKFEEARSRNPADCEIGYYLQAVHAEQGRWRETAGVAASSGECFVGAEAELRKEIDELRAAEMAPDRRQRQIDKREHQIATGARMRAAAWFNAAVASFNLGRKEEARGFAAKVSDDQHFAARARALLNRLAP